MNKKHKILFTSGSGFLCRTHASTSIRDVLNKHIESLLKDN